VIYRGEVSQELNDGEFDIYVPSDADDGGDADDDGDADDGGETPHVLLIKPASPISYGP
jgi:hypothetical protein